MKLGNLALAAMLLPLAGAAASVSIQYDNGVFRVVGETFRPDQASAEASGFSVHIEGSTVPLFGTYSIENGQLSFRPRFPLSPDVTYVAALGSEAGPGLVLPAHKQAAAPTTRVLAMYPSSPTLPDNQLKLYLVFSAPMQGGEGIFSKIHLIDSSGAPAYLPFVSQELWNRNYTRLTLIFDPGRIKRGVKPNVDMGPVLTEGRHYTLIVDRELKDGNGNPLAEVFRHDFAAGASERRGIDPAQWKLSEPHAGTTEPLVVAFDRPLDYALLQDVFEIPGVEGKATVGAGETEWRFQPAQPWKAGEHSLIIDMALEDQAGNRIGRPFDVDTMTSPTERISKPSTSLTFRIR